MIKNFNHINKVSGVLKLPGDKSISHRSVMFAAMASGKSEIYNCLESEDVISTIKAFREMDCTIEDSKDKITVHGNGLFGLKPPDKDLYLGNSGTTTRLLTGILSAQKFNTKITGDKSLSSRPMKRIIDPLTQMGAKINSNGGFLPIEIYPAENLLPIEYKLPIASAQIKSCILLAGLHLKDETIIVENRISRDHTERMLGLKILEEGNIRKIFSSSENYPQPNKYVVPSDISTASFFIVLTLLLKNSELILRQVSLNKSRIGIINILRKMGADINFENYEIINGESRGDIIIRSSSLKNIEISADIIPNIIDEIPILSIAGIFADGDFIIRNASELRYKESDRIKSLCKNFLLLGLEVNEFDDGFTISGKHVNNIATFKSYDDHRIAMAFSILSLLLQQGGNVSGFNCVNISNPKFLEQLKIIT